MVVGQLVQHGSKSVFEVPRRENGLQEGRRQRAGPARPSLSRNGAPHGKVLGTRFSKATKRTRGVGAALPSRREDGDPALHAK